MVNSTTICRIWHGWTTTANANLYEDLLKKKILPGIHRVKGYKGAQLLRGDDNNGEVEFITITYFDSYRAIIDFAGDDITRAVIPEDAQKLLLRFDEHSAHYEMKFDDSVL